MSLITTTATTKSYPTRWDWLFMSLIENKKTKEFFQNMCIIRGGVGVICRLVEPIVNFLVSYWLLM